MYLTFSYIIISIPDFGAFMWLRMVRVRGRAIATLRELGLCAGEREKDWSNEKTRNSIKNLNNNNKNIMTKNERNMCFLLPSFLLLLIK